MTLIRDSGGATPDLAFEANLPTDAQTPVKPTRDFSALTGRRRVRVWIDAYLDPGDTERLLLLGEETFDVEIRRRPKVTHGAPRIG